MSHLFRTWNNTLKKKAFLHSFSWLFPLLWAPCLDLAKKTIFRGIAITGDIPIWSPLQTPCSIMLCSLLSPLGPLLSSCSTIRIKVVSVLHGKYYFWSTLCVFLMIPKNTRLLLRELLSSFFLGVCSVCTVFCCNPNTLFLAGTMCETLKWAFFPWSIFYICFGQGRRKVKSNHLTTPLTLPWQVFHRSEKTRCCPVLGHVKHFSLVSLPLFSIQPRISSAVNTDGAMLAVSSKDYSPTQANLYEWGSPGDPCRA